MPHAPGPAPRVIDAETEHTINNHLAVIAGYCDLLIADTPIEDRRHANLLEINRSVRALVGIFRSNARC